MRDGRVLRSRRTLASSEHEQHRVNTYDADREVIVDDIVGNIVASLFRVQPFAELDLPSIEHDHRCLGNFVQNFVQTLVFVTATPGETTSEIVARAQRKDSDRSATTKGDSVHHIEHPADWNETDECNVRRPNVRLITCAITAAAKNAKIIEILEELQAEAAFKAFMSIFRRVHGNVPRHGSCLDQIEHLTRIEKELKFTHDPTSM